MKMYREAGAVQRQGKDGKVMYQVALGQQPGQLYCMIDGGVVIEAEKEMESILSRLKNIWQLRQSITIEVGMHRKDIGGGDLSFETIVGDKLRH
jgi:mediator of RNA polymerase II transcription subunit 20